MDLDTPQSPEHRVFRQHCCELIDAINDPKQLAWGLYAKELIPEETKAKVQERECDTTTEKSRIAVHALEKTIKAQPAAFHSFCDFLQNTPDHQLLTDLGRRLKRAYHDELRTNSDELVRDYASSSHTLSTDDYDSLKGRNTGQRNSRLCEDGHGKLFNTQQLDELRNTAFNEWPCLFRSFYGRTRANKYTTTLFVAFIGYQILASILIGICKHGVVFYGLKGSSYVIIHLLVMFVLQLCIRIITPLCLSQLPLPTRAPHEVVARSNGDLSAFNKVKQIWKERVDLVTVRVVVLHSGIFVFLLYYLGVFVLMNEHLSGNGVCNFTNYDTVIIGLGNNSLRVLALLELVSWVMIIFIITTAAELYCNENEIARKLLRAGANLSEHGYFSEHCCQVYKQIRRDWRAVDYYCLFMPPCLFGLLLLSVITGKVFTPSFSSDVKADDIHNWGFWIMVLSVLMFLATSVFKLLNFYGSLGAYAMVIIFIIWTGTKGVDTTTTGSSVMVLLFVSLAVVSFNLLGTFAYSHYHWCNLDKQRSHKLVYYCVVCLTVLPIVMCVAVYRELLSFTQHL